MESITVYVFQGTSLLVPDNPGINIYEEVSRELADAALARIDKKKIDCFSVASLDGKEDIQSITISEGELPSGWKSIPLRQVLSILTEKSVPPDRIGRILRAHHISLWRNESRFCGSCGGVNRDACSGELARQCEVCGRLEFPRISPAVITIITNEREEAVLAHNKKFTPGVYSLIAGFNEAGESLEETVAREIKEEINLEVRDIRYISSQPWPFPNSLMLGFSARHAGGELKPDGIEIEDARWFSRDALPCLPGSASLSRYLIDLWLCGKL